MKTTEPAAVAAAFQQLKEHAESRRRETRDGKPVILVGAATCGRAAGAIDVLQAFRDEVKKHNIDVAGFKSNKK